MIRAAVSILIVAFSGMLSGLWSQSLVPEPVPKFRYNIPIPEVDGQGVREAVMFDYEIWLADSQNIQRRTFQLDKTGKEDVVFEYRRDGKVARATKIFPNGYRVNADWEQIYLYDSLNRLAHIRAHYVGHADGSLVYPDSTAYQYDAEGRLVEVMELNNYRYVEEGVSEESGWRTRYTYMPGGRVAAREKCRTKMAGVGGMKCGVDSVDFNEAGKCVQVRWMVKTYRDSLGNYPPERAWLYDDAGRLVNMIEYGFGTEYYRTTYEYNPQGQVISETRVESRVKTGNADYLRIHYRSDGLADRVESGAIGRGSTKFDFKILYDFY